jgi:hypothetical protein
MLQCRCDGPNESRERQGRSAEQFEVLRAAGPPKSMGLCTRNRPESLGRWLKLGYSDTGFASGISMAALWGVNKSTAEPELA